MIGYGALSRAGIVATALRYCGLPEHFGEAHDAVLIMLDTLAEQYPDLNADHAAQVLAQRIRTAMTQPQKKSVVTR